MHTYGFWFPFMFRTSSLKSSFDHKITIGFFLVKLLERLSLCRWLRRIKDTFVSRIVSFSGASFDFFLATLGAITPAAAIIEAVQQDIVAYDRLGSILLLKSSLNLGSSRASVSNFTDTFTPLLVNIGW